VGACAGGGYALSQRNVYEASTSVIIVPQRVPDSFVRSTVTAGLTERLSIISSRFSAEPDWSGSSRSSTFTQRSAGE